MQTSRIIRPVNSIIFICDRAGGTVPHWQKDRQILSTDSCISVACYPEQDGPTKVTLGFASEVDPGRHADFNGVLKAANRVLTIQNVPHETLLAMNVTKKIIRVQVWLNSKKWADDVIIGVSES